MKIEELIRTGFALSLSLCMTFNPSAFSLPQQTTAQVKAQFNDARRANFQSGRDLLHQTGVSFDPDDLLRDDWPKHLKPALDAMPEMHQSRYEEGPLHGVYFADTLYLPEKVSASDHVVIVANNVVFEGNEPVIRALGRDIHFFPASPVAVLGSGVSEFLAKHGQAWNVSASNKHLPSFSTFKGSFSFIQHRITIDSSGREPAPPNKLRLPSILKRASLFQNQDNSGAPGQPGAAGVSPGPAQPGNNEPPAAGGTCSNTGPTGLSQNGQNGENGSTGDKGEDGTNGGNGNPGENAGSINATVADGDTNQYTFLANGGGGGAGGPGGFGGQGGAGGIGGDGGPGANCGGCVLGNGGNAGAGGDGGAGGDAGNGANGGNGGNGGTITVSLPFNSPGANTKATGGAAGSGGSSGLGGSSGAPEAAGQPGSGAISPNCSTSGASGTTRFAGAFGHSGANGTPGQPGASGLGGTVNVTTRQPPPSGGGNPNTCLGGSSDGSDPNGGSGDGGFSNGSGGVAPVCSPIIVDVENEGFHLTSVANGVTFDITGTNHPVRMAWTDGAHQNAFLALPGSDGLVRNGKQLFGNFTPQPPSAHPNGFAALAQFDSNHDGVIDDQDSVFSLLRLWIDSNHDGVCQPGEMHLLSDYGVYVISLNYKESRHVDEFGNLFRYKSTLNTGSRKDVRDNGPDRLVYDVFFR